MRERPEKWEVVCTLCLAGLIMPDEEVIRRLSNDRLWPKHCGKIMMLRHVLVVDEKPRVCSHIGCNYAQNARCGCDCEGRYHGVHQEYREYDKPIIAPKPWYKKPIRELITA